MEGAGRRKQFFITEKSKGVISWIQFGEESLSSLLKGVNECRRKKVSDRWRLEWKEEKRSFRLERRSNKAGRFLLCEVRDGEGKKHSLIFPEGKDSTKGWDCLANKLEELGINGKQEEKLAFLATNTQTDKRSFTDTVKLQRSHVNTI